MLRRVLSKRLGAVWPSSVIVLAAGWGASAPDALGRMAADGARSPLYVAEGDRVGGYGVVVSDGREVRMCGGPAAIWQDWGPASPYPASLCPDGVLLRGFSTRDLVVAGAIRAGNVSITGVWRDGALDVDGQSPTGELGPWTSTGFDSSVVPCREPAGGWSNVLSFPHEDYPAALLRLREPHRDALVTASLAPSEHERVLGVVAADTEAASRIVDALTPRYGSSICVVVSPYSAADYENAARGADGVVVGEPQLGPAMTLVVTWSALIVDDEVQAALDQLPDGLVQVSSLLRPVGAGTR